MGRSAVTDRPQWYQIRNAAPTDSGPAEVLIYDEIDSWFGVSAEQLARDISALDPQRALTVRINSPGGNVYDGVAILNALRGHPGTVTVVVDGLAASAASVIAMGGDEVVMNRNSEMMLHNGSALVVGGSEDMRKMADRLEQVNANLASIYAERCGGTAEEWRAIMAAETWYSAEEAVAAGLADRVDTGSADARAIAAKFDLSAFAHAGRANAPTPPLPTVMTLAGISPAVDAALEAVRSIQTPLPQAEVTQVTHQPINEGERHMPTFNEGLAALFGLEPDADEDTIMAAATAALDKPAEPTIDEATKVAAKFGMTVVNTAQFDQMTATVADLSARRDAQIKVENETAIHNALASGRIDGDAADTWRKSLETNREGTLALLATLPANKAVPVDEIGHGVSREDQPADADKAYAYSQITGKTLGKDA